MPAASTAPFISSAQRLPNGNTLITEGSDGRVFEVTREHEIVWEYICPYRTAENGKMNFVYRAYRAPYEWVPQLEKPVETPIVPLDPATFRVPGAAPLGVKETVVIEGAIDGFANAGTCVAATD